MIRGNTGKILQAAITLTISGTRDLRTFGEALFILGSELMAFYLSHQSLLFVEKFGSLSVLLWIELNKLQFI